MDACLEDGEKKGNNFIDLVIKKISHELLVASWPVSQTPLLKEEEKRKK